MLVGVMCTIVSCDTPCQIMMEKVTENPTKKRKAEETYLTNERFHKVHKVETGQKETSVQKENLIDSIVSHKEGTIQAQNSQMCKTPPRNIIDSIIDDDEESEMNEGPGEVSKVEEVKKSSVDKTEESEPADKIGESKLGMKVDKISETWEDIIVKRVAKQMQMR